MKISKFIEQYFKHILISTYQKIVPLLKNAHCEYSSFKPGILLNMPAGLWVPTVKLCCSWQGLVSKMRYGVSDLIVYSVSHDLLSASSFYTLSTPSHSPGCSQWGGQRLPQRKLRPQPEVHMGFRMNWNDFLFANFVLYVASENFQMGSGIEF